MSDFVANIVLSIAIVGAIIGAFTGFSDAGIGGAIVGILAGFVIGALSAVFLTTIIEVLGPLVFWGGIIAGIVYIISLLWNVGKPA